MPYIASERSWTEKFCHRTLGSAGGAEGCMGARCSAWVETNSGWSTIYVQAGLRPKGEGWRRRMKSGTKDVTTYTDNDGRSFILWERPSNMHERIGYCGDLFGVQVAPEAMNTPHLLRAEDIEIEREQPKTEAGNG